MPDLRSRAASTRWPSVLRLSLSVATVLASVLVGFQQSASAQENQPTPAATEPPAPTATQPLPAGGRIVATGLKNPRGLTFGPDGWLYVAEAGAAGDEEVKAGVDHVTYHIGKTARVSRIAPDGGVETVLDNMPSVRSPDSIYGAANVAFIDQTLYVLTAAGGRDVGDPAYDNAILSVGPDRTATQVFDLTQMNLEDPPLARRQDPRADVEGGVPYGLTAFNGRLYATDANLETVTEIGPDGSHRRFVELPMSNRVLVALTPTPDGNALWLAEYGPIPHAANSSKIDQLTLDGTLSDAWTGLVETLGIAFGPDGSAYAVTFAATGRDPASGSLYRRTPDGKVTRLAKGLNFATGLAIGPDGNAYISVNGQDSEDGTGEIISIPLPGGSPSWSTSGMERPGQGD